MKDPAKMAFQLIVLRYIPTLRMQRGFQSRILVSWAASLLVHGALLAWLSVAFTLGQVGLVSVLDVQVIPWPWPWPGPRGNQVKPSLPRHAARPPTAVNGSGANSAVPPQPSVGNASHEGGSPAARSSYIAELRAAIESVKSYPAIARTRRQEGRVEVAFTLRKDGSITDVAVSRSSSFSSLDEAGTSTLNRLTRFKPIPDDVSREDLKLVLPLEFRLEN